MISTDGVSSLFSNGTHNAEPFVFYLEIYKQLDMPTTYSKFVITVIVICGALIAPTSKLSAQSEAAPSAVNVQEREVATGSGLEVVMTGGWVGLLIVGLLLCLSLTAAYLIFEHLMTIRRSELLPEDLSNRVREQLLAGQINEAEQACREKPSLLAFVILNGLSEAESGWTIIEKAAEDALAEQSARLLRKIEYLSVIGNLAPMIGLLGTVTGMIIAFQQVASTQGAAGAGQLAEGIYQALITTVGGLIVAIPSLGAFAVLRNRVDQFVAEATYTAQHTLAPLKHERRRTSDAALAPPPVQGVP